MVVTARVALAGGAATLTIGVLTGLARLGWHVPLVSLWALHHGPIMAVGFLGTLVATERALSHKHPLAFLSPVLGLGATLMLLTGVLWLAPFLAIGSALGLAIIVAQSHLLAPSIESVVAVAGALALAWGNVLWAANHPYSDAARGWIVFLALTIAAERFELTRFLPRTRVSRVAFVAFVALMILALPLSSVSSDLGARALGIGAMGLGAWLLWFDVARKTVRQKQFARFSGVCLFAASAWLVVAGLIALTRGLNPPEYDAGLHAVFLGFGFSMIFAHAPMLLGAAIGVRIPFTNVFWFHAVLLHFSVALRILADLVGLPVARSWAGIMHAVALLAFVISTLTSVARAKRRPLSI
ncbi:MAG: hypothetical protein FWD69_12145 [Polyangiaceae bacterium]|nr:hypothetical protein [Polyangiaceae bacterium]